MTKPRSYTRERVGAASVDGVCKKSHAIVRAARAREVDEPYAVRKIVLERARRLDRESALAHAGWTGERHLAVPTEQRGDLDELVLAADERRRRRREVAAAAAGRGDHGDRRVVREDGLLDAPELRSRLETQLVGEHAPCLLEHLECVRLPPAAVERQHQLAPQPLPERVVCNRRAQRRDQLSVLSERERNLEPLLERVHTQRLEPARLGVEPRRAGEALQGRTPPEVERRSNHIRRGPHVAVTQRAARLRQQFLEPHGIHMRVVQRIPIGRAGDRRLSQGGAKTRNVVVERIARGGRELRAPQAVDECVDVDDATISEREHCQQCLPLRSAHVRNPSAGVHLERAEKPDLQQCVRHGLMLPPSSLPRPGAGIQATAVVSRSASPGSGSSRTDEKGGSTSSPRGRRPYLGSCERWCSRLPRGRGRLCLRHPRQPDPAQQRASRPAKRGARVRLYRPRTTKPAGLHGRRASVSGAARRQER